MMKMFAKLPRHRCGLLSLLLIIFLFAGYCIMTQENCAYLEKGFWDDKARELVDTEIDITYLMDMGYAWVANSGRFVYRQPLPFPLLKSYSIPAWGEVPPDKALAIERLLTTEDGRKRVKYIYSSLQLYSFIHVYYLDFGFSCEVYEITYEVGNQGAIRLDCRKMSLKRLPYASYAEAYRQARLSVHHPTSPFHDRFFSGTFRACGREYEAPPFILSGEYVHFNEDRYIRRVPPDFPYEEFAASEPVFAKGDIAMGKPGDYQYYYTKIVSSCLTDLTHVFVKVQEEGIEIYQLLFVHYSPGGAQTGKTAFSTKVEREVEIEDLPDLRHDKNIAFGLSRYPHPRID
jgi:hypothetical protein